MGKKFFWIFVAMQLSACAVPAVPTGPRLRTSEAGNQPISTSEAQALQCVAGIVVEILLSKERGHGDEPDSVAELICELPEVLPSER